jgi:outer membrane receptor protein involved in Fe transport
MRACGAFIVWATLALAGPAAAQGIALVIDASGAPVPGATVTMTAGGTTRTVTTSDNGVVPLPDAMPDGMRLSALAPGFTAAVVDIRADTPRPVRLVLRPQPFLDVVTVTAARGAENLATAASTTVLTSAELLNTAAGALDDALRNTPGFSLFRRSSSRVSNPTTQGVTLRGVSGSGASRTMVLADGLPLNDAFGSWVYWNRVPQAAVERIEVVRGATGDLYGADALGGVVQVLTFAPGRTRVRGTLDAGSHDTWRTSLFGGGQRRGWHGTAAGEWLRTDGVVTIAPEARGPVDVEAESDYGTGFLEGGYSAAAWRAHMRVSLYSEERGNGTPLQINTTEWTQVSGEASGGLAGGVWQARAAGGTQTYFQTFSAVLAGRASERLTTDQDTPSTFSTFGAQWIGTFRGYELLAGGEGKHTESTVTEMRYGVTGAVTGPFVAGGAETSGSGFARVGLHPADALTVVVGARADFWQSRPTNTALPTHTSAFLSPRASAAYEVSEQMSLQAAAYRAYRTPTLNELHRGFRVGNIVTDPNPLLDPERLSGFEGGVLARHGRVAARATAFWNQLDNAVTNVTIASTPAQITRQRQNTDTVRASGLEVEVDVRPTSRWTIGGMLALTRSRFANAPAQPALEGNRTPQVPAYHWGGSLMYVDPRAFTGSLQLRVVSDQFDDDLNQFQLDRYAVVDASATQALRHGVQVFVGVENLFDTEYDVGRTPVRTIGWPRTLRVGLRVFLPQ